ncbi:MAG: adenine phosphoribosyltransferase [Tenacibaculum sp.]|nr:adenine phosphoribosyltransferase [Tenacibaculum sp.]
MNIEKIKKSIRNVPDFPKKGIQFKDITTALKEPEVLQEMVNLLYEHYKDKGITKVVGIESRGFIIGSILAYKLGAGFVMLRKPGKLPADKFKIEYELEYGTDSLEIHKDAISENDVLLLHDDLLATGGSANASLQLLRKFGNNPVYLSFLIELTELNGTSKLSGLEEIYSLVKY